MTIQLTQARVVNGAVAAAGTQHTLAESIEADFITNGWATRVGDAPDQSGLGVPVMIVDGVLMGPDGAIPLTVVKTVIGSTNTVPVPASTLTLLDLTTGVLFDPYSLFDSGADKIRNPNTGLGDVTLIGGVVSVQFPANASGTYRGVQLQQEVSPGIFVPYGNFQYLPPAPVALGTVSLSFVITPAQILSMQTSFQIKVQHDATASLSCLATFEFNFMKL